MNRCNIILIGFMGSGKSAFGRWLSSNLNMDFCDTDEYIENKQGKTISEIFAQNGEIYFRNLETEAVRELYGRLENSVLSVGGGLPLREENRILLRRIGKVVYLQAVEDTLVSRLKGDTQRPLLAGTDIRSRIKQLMEARADKYEDAADIVVNTDKKRFDQIYAEIKDEL